MGEVSVDRTIVEGIDVVEEGLAVVVRTIVDPSPGSTRVVVAVTVVGSSDDDDKLEESPSARTSGRPRKNRTMKRKLRSNRGRWYTVE